MNDYNPIILLLWEANVDIQFIRESSYVLDRYITAYITKGEKQATQEIWDNCHQNKNLRSCLKSYALKSFKNRECGIFEVADKLLGYSLSEFSDVVKYLPALPSIERKRALKDIKSIKQLDDHDKNIYHNNMIDTYYPNRAEDLENMCLYDVVSWYEYKSGDIHANQNKNLSKLKNDFGYLHKRQKPKVIKIPYIKVTDYISLERHCYQMLLLFFPWRDEKKLKTEDQSYQESFQQITHNNNLFNESRYNSFQIKKKKINDALDYIKTVHESEENKGHCEESELETNVYDLGAVEFKNEIVDKDLVDSKVNNLNLQQLEVFKYVIDIIQKQEKRNDVNLSNNITKNARIFCSGVAGKV